MTTTQTLRLTASLGHWTIQNPDKVCEAIRPFLAQRQRIATHYQAYLNGDQVDVHVCDNFIRQLNEVNLKVGHLLGVNGEPENNSSPNQ